MLSESKNKYTNGIQTLEKMRTLFISITLLCFHVYVQAQDTIPIETVQSSTLGDSISSVDANRLSETTDLLPEHYLFTQRLLWSEKGLMRNIPVFELSQSSRDLEMDIRSYATLAHEYLGYASLIGMIGTGITGQQLYTGSQENKDLHELFSGFTNVCYFSTAGLAFLQPPPMHNRADGVTKLNIHRTLSILHLSSMIATNVLSGMQEDNAKLKPYHKAAAITAFSSLFLATVVIKL